MRINSFNAVVIKRIAITALCISKRSNIYDAVIYYAEDLRLFHLLRFTVPSGILTANWFGRFFAFHSFTEALGFTRARFSRRARFCS